MDYSIRKVRKEDLDRVVEVEALCFPPEEAAGREAILQRIALFPESFLVAELSDGTIIGFINGCVTEGNTICDEMFEKADFHNPDGAYQSVFGLDVIKEWRGRGVAAALMKRFIEEAGKEILGSENVVKMVNPTMGGEDFSYFQLKVPASFFVIGTYNPSKGLTNPLHNPRFNIDEDILPKASAVMAQCAIDYLSNN